MIWSILSPFMAFDYTNIALAQMTEFLMINEHQLCLNVF